MKRTCFNLTDRPPSYNRTLQDNMSRLEQQTENVKTDVKIPILNILQERVL